MTPLPSDMAAERAVLGCLMKRLGVDRVVAELRRTGKLDEAGGEEGVRSLVNHACNERDLPHFLARLEKAKAERAGSAHERDGQQ